MTAAGHQGHQRGLQYRTAGEDLRGVEVPRPCGQAGKVVMWLFCLTKSREGLLCLACRLHFTCTRTRTVLAYVKSKRDVRIKTSVFRIFVRGHVRTKSYSYPA